MAESTSLARPYARAAFESARESNQLDAWSDSLNLLSVVVGKRCIDAFRFEKRDWRAFQHQRVIDFECPPEGLHGIFKLRVRRNLPVEQVEKIP